MNTFQLDPNYAAPSQRSVNARTVTAAELKTDFLRDGRLLLRHAKGIVMHAGWDGEIVIDKGRKSESGSVSMLLIRQGCRYGLMVRLWSVPDSGWYWHARQRVSDSVLIDVCRCVAGDSPRVVSDLVSWHPMGSDELAERLLAILKTMPT